MTHNPKDQKVPGDLVKHLQTREEKDEFIKQIVGSAHVLNIYRKVIEDRKKISEESKESDYNDASWAYKQADNNGYIRALKEVLRLFPRPN